MTGECSAVADDISPYQLGTEGWFQGVHFGIIGRVRMSWQSGFWNEWYLYFDDGRFGWLGEAQGHLAILFEQDHPEILEAARDIFKPADLWGAPPKNGILIANQMYRKRDTKVAHCLAMEGELPKAILRNQRRVSVDLASAGRGYATLEYDPYYGEVRVFLGESVAFKELRFSFLRELEGWSPH